MRTSWNWLSEFVDLEGLTPQEVADGLTQAGVEVEGIDELGRELDGVVVGRIIKRDAHEGADKLSVCEVDVGTDEPLQIVCGAPNARQDLVSAVATVGTTLPGDFKIKKSKIRGVPSFGMLCSNDELGTTGDASGILELAGEHAPGTPIADVLGLRDFIFDISLTPNRPDCLSTFGLAREIGTIFGRKLKRGIAPSSNPFENAGPAADVKLEVRDADGCPRYACAVIRNVKVGPSPDWMQRTLQAIGQRPVNNLVDVTNYAMFENGQPLHAFDLNVLKDQTIIVRRADEGETIESIDHVERKLRTDDLLICDATHPVAIAGVMGGAGSEISDETTDILLECAYFDPSTVRRTARRQGMHTESSHRFERGVDPNMVPECLARAVELVVATQEAIGQSCEVAAAPLDTVSKAIEPCVIMLPRTMPSRILGIDISGATIKQTLTSLGLTVEDPLTIMGDSEFKVTVPTFRPDLERPIDLVEEVGRVIGFDNLLDALPLGQLGYRHERRDDAPVVQHAQPVQEEEQLTAIRRTREALADQGFSEAVNWAIADPIKLNAIRGEETRITIQNPVTEDRTTMRTTLLTGLLDNVAHNIAHGAERIALFELGTVFPAKQDANGERAEPTSMAAVLSGRTDQAWYGTDRAVTGHDLVGLVDAASEVLRRPLEIVTAEAPGWAHPGVTANITLKGEVIGWIGAMHPNVLDTWDIEQGVYAMELDLAAVLSVPAEDLKHAAIPRTPASTRDLALLIDRTQPYADVRDAMGSIKNKILESIEILDLYEGDKIASDKKSLTLRMTYRKENGSLTDKQVEGAHRRITSTSRAASVAPSDRERHRRAAWCLGARRSPNRRKGTDVLQKSVLHSGLAWIYRPTLQPPLPIEVSIARTRQRPRQISPTCSIRPSVDSPNVRVPTW